MYTAILRVQWKNSAVLLLFLTLGAFSIPVWQLLGAQIFVGGDSTILALPILQSLSQSSGMFPLLAFVTGFSLALATWYDDHLGKHTYALILPVPRWYYLMLRLAVGLTFAGAVVVALWISAVIATSQVNLPAGLHTYAGALTVRFALATSVAFTMFFVLLSLGQRAQRIVLYSVLGAFVVLIVLASSGASSWVEWIVKRVFGWPGFIDAFNGRWLLIDV